MNWLQNLLDSSTMPALTAFLLGLLTAISPCPLATNIAAVGYIGKQAENTSRAFRSGLLYTLGRILTYGILGAILIALLHTGESVFRLQRSLSQIGETVLGPALLVIGIFMLIGDRLPLRGFGFRGRSEGLTNYGSWGALGLGMLLALAFCPTSAVFYFGMLIPMAAGSTMGYLLPVIFAIATALPVLVVAWIIAYSAGSLGRFYQTTAKVQKWLNRIVAVLFIGVGIYYLITMFI